MSTIWLHVGQAGNQLAEHIWKSHADYIQPVYNHNTTNNQLPITLYSPSLCNDLKVRALLIDTEPKVVAAVHSRTQFNLHNNNNNNTINSKSTNTNNKSLFRNSNVVYEQSGRGNNWALGYSDDSMNDNSVLTKTLQSLHNEIERSDITIDGICVVSSTSGGTGSGLGSRIVETIRDVYPRLSILSCCVLPYANGETPLQHYNSIFTLAHHYMYTDAVMLFNNNDIHNIISHATARYSTTPSNSASANGLQSVSFDIMNRYISDCILDIVAPTQYAHTHNKNAKNVLYNAKTHSTRALPVVPTRITDLIQHNCPMSSMKLLESYTTSGLTELANEVANINSARPKTAAQRKLSTYNQSTTNTSTNWNGLIDQLSSIVPKYTTPASTFAYSVYTRGDMDNTFNIDTQNRIDIRMNKIYSPVAWNTNPSQYITSSIPPLSHFRTLNNSCSSKSIATLVNRAYNSTRVSALLDRGRLMYDNNAFTHWYQRYGIDDNEFNQAFDTVQTIIDNYKQLTMS